MIDSLGCSPLRMATRCFTAGSTLLFLFAILSVSHPVAAQTCPFADDDCIDPLAQTAVPLSFAPLFPQNISFYYGFDAQDTSSSAQLPLDGQDGGPIVKASFWLGFGHDHIDGGDIQANRTSELAVRVGNLTGSPSGGNNGCDGVWGPQCSADIMILLKRSIYNLSVMGSYYVNPLQTVLGQICQTPPPVSSCPPSLFNVQSIPVEPFAQENEVDESVEIMDPGTNVSPWKTWYIHQVYASEQAEQVAVGIFSRGPTYGSYPLKNEDQVQIELVCVRAPQEAR